MHDRLDGGSSVSAHRARSPSANCSARPSAPNRIDWKGESGVLVERFDRVVAEGEAGGLLRLAQEDACQLMGRYPADKYRLSAEEVVTGLARVTDAPVVAARDLLRQLAFAYLSGAVGVPERAVRRTLADLTGSVDRRAKLTPP